MRRSNARLLRFAPLGAPERLRPHLGGPHAACLRQRPRDVVGSRARELLAERRRRRRAVLRIPREAAHDDRLETLRDLGPELAHRRDRLLPVLDRELRERLEDVRRPAGEALVEDAAEGVDVRGGGHLLAQGLLG